ncbi:hypothetical protein VKT23_010293 [Stygiomarasmius scandens]|uniref:F-box domain-containing protein n=1 Tax=Marasmiellus scandens TaxID=2682957 RepID=A0ABR1JC75_9AGAR
MSSSPVAPHKMLWQRLEPRITHLNSSYYLERINTPSFPSPFETRQISQVISDAEKDLLDYDQDISALRDLLSNLTKKRDDLALYKNLCGYYTSSIRHLPTEILAEIFLIYRDNIYENEQNPDCESLVDETSPLLTLGLVCKRWRAVTLGTPQLWTCFNLTLSSSFSRNPCPILNWLKLCLSRSAQLPLSFRLYHHYVAPAKRESSLDLDPDSEPTNSFSRIVKTLVEECHRWKHVTWVTHHAVEWYTLPFRGHSLPLLKSLELGDPGSIDMFSGARALESLTINDLYYTGPQLFEDLDTSRLCRLCIRSKYGWGFLDALAKGCPVLRSLILELSHARSERSSPSPSRVRFEVLEELTLQWMSWRDINKTFSVLTLPSLHKVSLCNALGGGERVEPSTFEATFSLFLSRTNYSLSALEIKDPWDMSTSIIRNMLKSTIGLTEVSLSEKWHLFITTSFLEMFKCPLEPDSGTYKKQTLVGLLILFTLLTPHPKHALQTQQQPETILPNLQKLKLTIDIDKKDFDESVLVEMIESRRPVVSDSGDQPQSGSRCLQSLELKLRGKVVEESMVRRLRSLRNAGMEVFVNTV